MPAIENALPSVNVYVSVNEPTVSFRPNKAFPELRSMGPVKVSAYDTEAATAKATAVRVWLSVTGISFVG